MVAVPLHHPYGVAELVLAPEVRGALAQHLHDSETLMLERLLEDRDHLAHVVGGRPRHEGRPRAEGEPHGVELAVDVAVGRRRRGHPDPGERRVLPSGHAVDAVVHDDRGELDIAPRRVDEMVAPDGQRVAVAHRYDDVQVGPRHLDARGEGQRPSVQRVHGVEVHVPRYAGRTADAGHHDEGRGIIAQIVHAVQHGVEHVPVAAAGAPQVRKETFPDQRADGHIRTPFLRSRA